MSLISGLREDLATACEAATGWVTHSEPPKSLATPCLIIGHGSPLMQAVEDDLTFSEAANQSLYTINLEVLALVSDNDAAIAAIETVIDQLIPVLLPTQVSELLVITYATNNYLGVRFDVTKFATYSD
jgi:hypothetical protein